MPGHREEGIYVPKEAIPVTPHSCVFLGMEGGVEQDVAALLSLCPAEGSSSCLAPRRKGPLPWPAAGIPQPLNT